MPRLEKLGLSPGSPPQSVPIFPSSGAWSELVTPSVCPLHRQPLKGSLQHAADPGNAEPPRGLSHSSLATALIAELKVAGIMKTQEKPF